MTETPTRRIDQPTADHLMALVHAYRRADTARQDELIRPWSDTASAAGILALSLLDLSARIAAYTGNRVSYDVHPDAPRVGADLLSVMADAVANDDAGLAYSAFIVTSTEHPDPDGWLPVLLGAAVAGLDAALRLTPA